MDDRKLTQRLKLADKHVALGAAQIARQRAMIETLQRASRDTSREEAHLAALQKGHVMHILERDRIAAELSSQD